jgi:DNA-binding transcriptional LysR family regulator
MSPLPPITTILRCLFLLLEQPTLSRHLRLLEEQSGATLLRRDTRRMSLTPTGQRLLADAQTVLAHAEAATQRLREDQTTLSGHLRLFVTFDLGQSIGYAVGQQFSAEPS